MLVNRSVKCDEVLINSFAKSSAGIF